MVDNSGIDLRNVEYSGTGDLPDGQSFSYPTLDDYVNQLIGQEAIASKSDLLTNPDNDQAIGAILLHWSRFTFAGCLFAAHLAKGHVAAKWNTAIVRLTGPISEFSAAIDSHLLSACEQKTEAVQLIFPEVFTADELVNLVNLLCAKRNWYWTCVPWRYGDAEAKLIGLRWTLPSNSRVVNYTLGFAPLETMPLTRRAPFTTLVLRTSDRIRRPPAGTDSSGRKLEADRVAVHLADMNSRIRAPERNSRFWTKTKAMKQERVGKDTSTARARVTFAVPFDQAKELVDPMVTELADITFEQAEQIIETGRA